MTMERHRDRAEVARAVLGQLASDVRKQRKDIATELRGLDSETDGVLIGARAALEDIDEERRSLLEELEEHDRVIDPSTAESTPDDSGTDVAPPPPPPPSPKTPPVAPPPVAPVQPPPTASATAAAAARATATATATTTAPPTRFNRADPRNWWILAWLLAVIGLLIGLYVGTHTSGFDSLHGTVHGWFTFGWVMACAGVGFFLGGTIGDFIDDVLFPFRHRPVGP